MIDATEDASRYEKVFGRKCAAFNKIKSKTQSRKMCSRDKSFASLHKICSSEDKKGVLMA